MNNVRISEIAIIIMGQSPKGDTCNQNGFGKPLLNGPTEFGEFHPSAKQFTTQGNRFSIKGDILFCVRGSTTGRMNWADREYVLGRGLASIRHKKGESLNHYLKYLIEYNINSILKSTSGSTFPNLTGEMLNSFHVAVLSENEAKKVNDLLKNLDAKIELNNKINRELEAMAKTLYDYWFVQFDFPNSDGRPYKSSGGKVVYNAELKREIPEGWEVKKMREVLSIKNGRDHKHLELGTIPVYGSGGIMRYANSSLYNSESILIPRKGSLGNLFYINKPFWCVDTIFYTQMKFPHTCKYLFYTVQNLNISSMNTGTAVPSMTTEVLNNLSLIFPPMEIIKRFDAILSPNFKMKDYRINENQHLTALRDWLLPMLMNGQVTVRQAEERISSSTELSQSMAAEPRAYYNRK
jgi:type I restriction enzyme S subunit